jgi:protein required for attachment to host cells
MAKGVLMSLKLIIVADLQRFKLFSVKEDPLVRESLELLENVESLETHQKMSEQVSDQHGNFKGVGASGAGENHNYNSEKERRRIKEIAAQVSNALQRHSHTSWCFAAPKAINNKIVELVDASAKKEMRLNLFTNLTKIPNDQLLEHFKKL